MDQEWIDSVSFQTISNFSWFTDFSILVLPKNYDLWPRRDFEEIQKNIFLREWSFLRNYCRLVQKLIGAKKITKYYLLLLNFGTRLGIVSIQSARSKVNGPKWAIRSGRFFIPLKKTDWNPSKSNILFLLIPPIMMVKFKQYGKVMDMPVNIVWEWVLNALNNLCQSFSKTLF